jgi:hypothetical protein
MPRRSLQDSPGSSLVRLLLREGTSQESLSARQTALLLDTRFMLKVGDVQESGGQTVESRYARKQCKQRPSAMEEPTQLPSAHQTTAEGKVHRGSSERPQGW